VADSRELLIVGAGLTGLAAASKLGDRAMLLERSDRPGGLVRSCRIGDYWFDLVIHLLYFRDPDTEAEIRSMLGDTLGACPPEAWVETSVGTCRFPIQMHLRGLRPEHRIRCIEEMAGTPGTLTKDPTSSIERLFVEAFGPTLSDLFMLPYNRKMWRRPLRSISARGLAWNIERPDFREVLRGAIDEDHEGAAYNSRGFYPRPPESSAIRGMEVLSHALASRVSELRLGCSVVRIDADRRVVVYETGSGSGTGTARGTVRYERGLLSSVPLPSAAELCLQTPPNLLRRLRSLRRNRVVSVFVAIEGPRPDRSTGHWRYYADESLCFTRLVFMHAFDPAMAPPSGWGLLVEIPQRSEDPPEDCEETCRRAVADARRVGVIGASHRVVGCRREIVDPAYVVLGEGDRQVVDEAIGFLAEHGIDCRGRYGAWKYCGMSQCLREGFEWARAMMGSEPTP